MRALLRLFFAMALLMPLAARAVEPSEILSDPKLESRARVLSLNLRCLVCQNQSIDDSNAPLAKDLRILVRERLTAGDSDAQVMDFLTKRYGDFILLSPPLKAGTILLWGAPFGVLLVGGLFLFYFGFRRKSAFQAKTLLSEEELLVLNKILEEK